jgi:DNA-binding NarL/FixJ family response regulator
MPYPVRVLLYEPSPVIAQALTYFLGLQSDLDPTAVTNTNELIARMASASLVLLALHSWGPHVLSLVERVRELGSARIAVLGLDPRPMAAALVLGAGADGYIHQRAEPGAFLAAIRSVARGETTIVGDGAPSNWVPGPRLEPTPVCLTPREREVISFIADDLTAQQIASTLGVSVRTVHVHLQHAYRKLGVHSRLGAVLAAGDAGLLAGGA